MLGGLVAAQYLQEEPAGFAGMVSSVFGRAPLRATRTLENPKLRYVDLPPDTTFVESASFNVRVSPHTAYVPIVTSKSATTGIYAVDLRTGAPKRAYKLLCALPISNLYFGSKLSATGDLYVCSYGPNRGDAGSLLVLSVLPNAAHTPRTIATFPTGFQPNDVALDPRDGRVFVACNDMPHNGATLRGTVLNLLQQSGLETSAVFECFLDGREPKCIADGLRVLAGSVIDPTANALWVSELTQLVRIPLTYDTHDWERIEPYDTQLLADNLEIVDGTSVLVFPFYRKITKVERIAFTNTKLASSLHGCLSLAACGLLNTIDAPPLTGAPDKARAAPEHY
jgi:hypothetical protein